MKLNRSTIFLLIALLAIWGGIVYVIYDKLRGNDTEQVIIQRTSLKHLVDSFSLKLDYVDPFGGINHTANTNVATHDISNNYATPSTSQQTAVSSDAIAYLGFIENKKQKSKSVLVRINGEEHVLQVGNVIDGYKIVSVTDQKLILLFNNNLISINRN